MYVCLYMSICINEHMHESMSICLYKYMDIGVYIHICILPEDAEESLHAAVLYGVE